ncbi:alpha-L-fucosidase [Mucilaginibacter sp. X5P1]|uniref:alpha-L-fucosidase n=1 Tax=Mucilaginibacter sp. X5P1 TaxID=2723088 RepID=UPI00161B6B89|nr:alpha-L-fucosidase [Mucilaginibacter sp. X5P1]MBB6139874.1 alpha-L-fucosidase [Mucilaginibacter sp. X5P1]
MKRLRTLFIPLLLITVTVYGQNKEQQNSAALKWFTDARYGMFIHWDMSSVAGTEISWSRKATKPLDITGDPAGYVEDPNYDNLYKKFNPAKFDATEWVRIAKEAGMKYIVFTAKHHGGFAMWNTKTSDYSIMNTPYGKDAIKQLAAACHKAGMKFGLYYSQRDWHNPLYGIGDNKAYINYMNEQIRELLTSYGKIDIIWWDSYGVGDLEKFWQIGSTYDLVKKLQPDIIMNNRLAVLGDYNKQPARYLGDWDTPEQTIGKFQNNRLWESCFTLVHTPDGGGWSYRPDGKVHSYAECINALVGCATGDGNLLLGIGPDATGVIPADQQERLAQISQWLKKYQESIYGTRGGPYTNGTWGGATFKGKKIYLHIRKWNGDSLTLPTLKGKIVKCTNLTNESNRATFVQDNKNLTIKLSADKQDSIDTIIMLELAGDASDELTNGKPIAVK